MLVDVHAHMLSSQFAADRKEVLNRNRDIMIVENGLNMVSNQLALELSEKFPWVKVALGLYPTDAVALSDDGFANNLDFIRKNSDKMVAVGEIGLDLQEIVDIKLQRKRFIALVELAKKLHKPVIVHSRKAEKEAVETLES